jgi:hypothetical protein
MTMPIEAVSQQPLYGFYSHSQAEHTRRLNKQGMYPTNNPTAFY